MSPTSLIFGGSGKCARHITRLLVGEGHTVYSIIRNPDQKADIEALGGKPIVQSIEDSSVDDMVKTIQSTKPQTVIWAAGAGGGNPERTRAVDNEGAIRSMDAVSASGITKRYIIISAIDVRDRTNKPEPEWYNDTDRDRSNRVWTAIQPYMLAKLASDTSLVTQNARRGLEYTIIRPGGLNQEPGTGKIAAGRVHLDTTVSREDVAAAVVECMRNEGTKGLAIDLVGGGEGERVSVREAIEGVVKGRVDGFEGRY